MSLLEEMYSTDVMETCLFNFMSVPVFPDTCSDESLVMLTLKKLNLQVALPVILNKMRNKKSKYINPIELGPVCCMLAYFGELDALKEVDEAFELAGKSVEQCYKPRLCPEMHNFGQTTPVCQPLLFATIANEQHVAQYINDKYLFSNYTKALDSLFNSMEYKHSIVHKHDETRMLLIQQTLTK